MDSRYLTSAQKASQLPPVADPEVLLLGRSNCGKSTLLNALTGRRHLARTSARPGRTQMANFFTLSNGAARLTLVDLPGYGYAEANRAVRKHWDELLQACLARPRTARVYFLADARRLPDAAERTFIRSLTQPVQIVLTKWDKPGQKERQKLLAAWKRALPDHPLATVSSPKGLGIDRLRDDLWQAISATHD